MPVRKTKKATGPTPVDAITHADKRTNLPTADAQEFLAPELEQPLPVRYARDPSLDPQLVWRGKDFESDPLEVDTPPIYIQEKVQPRAIIEDLRKQTNERRKSGAPQFDTVLVA